MSHTQTVPSKTEVWDHLYFKGRRNSSPGRFMAFDYGRFESQEDADKFPDVQPSLNSGQFGVKADMLDKFFLDEEGSYQMNDKAVFGCLMGILSGNFTQSELDNTFGLKTARERMAGVEFKVNGKTAFTVSELPEERA